MTNILNCVGPEHRFRRMVVAAGGGTDARRRDTFLAPGHHAADRDRFLSEVLRELEEIDFQPSRRVVPSGGGERDWVEPVPIRRRQERAGEPPADPPAEIISDVQDFR